MSQSRGVRGPTILALVFFVGTSFGCSTSSISGEINDESVRLSFGYYTSGSPLPGLNLWFFEGGSGCDGRGSGRHLQLFLPYMEYEDVYVPDEEIIDDEYLEEFVGVESSASYGEFGGFVMDQDGFWDVVDGTLGLGRSENGENLFGEVEVTLSPDGEGGSASANGTLSGTFEIKDCT
jgi:hypothetical protein